MPQKEHHRQATRTPVKGFFHAAAITLKSSKLGDLLLASGLITRHQLDAALAEQKKTKEQLGKVLIRLGSVSAVQVYQKLAQQWCLKASAAGLTILMQAAIPTTAHAQEFIDNGISVKFTLAAATASGSAMRHSMQYPSLFGTHEVRSNDISAFKKWTDVMVRFEGQMKTVAASSPRAMLWKAEIARLQGRSQREQIKAVNEFFNQITYIEDIDNYGKSDKWATPLEFLARGGDCEDFAIAKYASLRALGFSNDQMRIAIVNDKIKGIPHAILIVYSDEGNYVLDNQNKKTETITAVTRYEPIFSINSESWWLHKA